MAIGQTTSFGVVHPSELYTLEAIKVRLGIGDSILRAARRAGLRVHYLHGRGFVYGEDLIGYIRSHSGSSR